MKQLVLSLLASAALVTPALACPNMEHDEGTATKTVEKDKKEAPKTDKAKETPKADAKTDTAKNQKDAPKDTKGAKDSKDTAKKPDKVSSK